MRQNDITLLIGYASSEEECINYSRYYLKKKCTAVKTTVTKINTGTAEKPNYRYYLVFAEGSNILSEEDVLFDFNKISIIVRGYSTETEMHDDVAYFTQLGYELLDITALKINAGDLFRGNKFTVIFKRRDLYE
jgi:hypothetical protein